VNPANGGPINFLAEMSGYQDELGFKMEVVCLDTPEQAKLSRLECAVHPTGPSMPGYGFTPRFVAWLSQHASDYDVVLLHGIWQFASFGTWMVLNHKRPPYAVYPHGMLDPWFNETYPLKRLKKMLYWPWAEYRVLRDARAVLFTSEEERELARHSFRPYRCNEVVAGFGSPEPTGDLANLSTLFLNEFPRLRQKRLLLYCGRLHPKKGVDLLLEAFAHTAAGHPELELVLAGPCSQQYRNELSRLVNRLPGPAREQVTWTGMLVDNLKWGAFASANAFILPSHQENFAVSMSEALSCGTPVLITKRVNTWRAVAQYDAGLVESDDSEGILNLCKHWVELSPVRLSELKANARRCYLENFEMRSYLQRLLGLLAGYSSEVLDSTMAGKEYSE
jgi:glycosyltransferase involved in cell wall biosynthesis